MAERGLARADEVKSPVGEDRRGQNPRRHPRDVRIIPKSRDFR
jgi:error-prone DNA polymerase